MTSNHWFSETAGARIGASARAQPRAKRRSAARFKVRTNQADG
jgi:hypothetical protein